MLRKKILSLFTAFAMLTSFIPMFTYAAGAAEAKYQLSEGGEWQTASLKEAVENVYDGGTIGILSDIVLTESITVSKSVTITSSDKENPCTISHEIEDNKNAQENGFGIMFNADSGKFNLENIILDGGNRTEIYHPLVYVRGAEMTLGNGAVIQNNYNRNSGHVGGGAVCLRAGKLIMENGSKITSCICKHGGGIEVNSKTSEQADFTMNGGSIENCQALSGGGMYVNFGTFHLKGGEIKNNIVTGSTFQTGGGGGIYISGVSKDTNDDGVDDLPSTVVYIEGGRVIDNKSNFYGGGIRVNHPKAILAIRDGVISGNSASYGAGIAGLHGNILLYGGEVSKNTVTGYAGGILCAPGGDCYITISGNPKVTENTPDNFYLDGVDNSVQYATTPVRIIDGLSDDAYLGMSRWVLPDAEANPGRITFIPYETESQKYTITESDLAKIHADDKTYAFILHEGEILMVLAVDVTLDKTELTFTDKNETEQLTAAVTPDNAIIKDVTWSSDNEAIATVDENGIVKPKGNGICKITATTVSPYNATASCDVTVNMPTYNLTAKAVHGTLTFTPDSPVIEDTQITLTAAPDEGYKFSSFKVYKDGDESITADVEENKFIMPPYDMIAEAEFQPIEYSITYDLNEGALQNGETNPNSYTIESGAITLKNPVRTGYSFKGWTGTDLEEISPVVTIPIHSAGDRNYTAVWEMINYEVTFDAGENGKITDGSPKVSVQYNSNINEDSIPTVSANDGYKFIGWFTEKDGGEEFTTETVITDNITVYAQWEEIKNTVTFDANNGEWSDSDTTKTVSDISYNRSVGEDMPENPVRTGFIFKGWFTEEDGGEEFTTETVITDNITVYAQWEEIKNTVTFDANNGEWSDSDTTKTVSDISYNRSVGEDMPENPSRTGFIFKGWFTEEDGGEEFTTETIVTDNSTVYAQWEEIKNTVTFDANNGEWSDSDTTKTVSDISYNRSVGEDMPENPVRTGFIFKGWFTEEDGGEEFTTDTAVTDNSTVYARWSKVPTPSPSPSAAPTAKPSRHGGSLIKTTPTPKPTDTPVPESTPTAAPSVPDGSNIHTAEHLPYIVGYPDGEFKPDNSISRAEVAAILARLTEGFSESEVYTSAFPDVSSAAWYRNYIGFEENRNIIVGYPDGEFKPERFITRAEFVAMIARYTQLDCTNGSDYPFLDIKHWAYAQIIACHNAGYIEGYEDNTFRPEAYITRAEAVTIVNRVIDRVPYDISVNNCIPSVYQNIFVDMTKNHWGYYNVMEAAIRHNAEDFH